MDLLVATIEHSGTFTLLGLLNYEGRGGKMLRERASGICFAHLWDSEMPLILEAAQRMPVITTNRPFQDIRESWRRRGKDLKQLDLQFFNYAQLIREVNPFVVRLGAKQ